MQFGGAVTATAGTTFGSSGSCFLADWDLVYEVRVAWVQSGGFQAPVALTFVSSAQVCGPYGTQGSETAAYTGEGLAYFAGRVGTAFDQLVFVFAC